MIHPDILLLFVRQRQRELWDEAAQARRVQQLKTATRRLPSGHTRLTGEGAHDDWDDALQEVRTSGTQPKRVAGRADRGDTPAIIHVA